MKTRLQVVYPLYCRKYNNNYDSIKDIINIVTSQTERRIVSTTVGQIITVRDMTSIRLCYNLVTSYGGRVNVV